MPLYEYECQQCHRRVEKIQKFSDAPLTTCPHCGGVLERTITAPAVQFKGSGWYKDLYSSAKPPAAPGGGESASASGEAAAATGDKGSASEKASGGGEAKTAAATPATPVTAPSAPSGGSGS